jgi:hypothetical protein
MPERFAIVSIVEFRRKRGNNPKCSAFKRLRPVLKSLRNHWRDDNNRIKLPWRWKPGRVDANGIGPASDQSNSIQLVEQKRRESFGKAIARR